MEAAGALRMRLRPCGNGVLAGVLPACRIVPGSESGPGEPVEWGTYISRTSVLISAKEWAMLWTNCVNDAKLEPVIVSAGCIEYSCRSWGGSIGSGRFASEELGRRVSESGWGGLLSPCRLRIPALINGAKRGARVPSPTMRKEEGGDSSTTTQFQTRRRHGPSGDDKRLPRLATTAAGDPSPQQGPRELALEKV